MIVLHVSAALAMIAESQATATSRAFMATSVDSWIAPAVFAYDVRGAILSLHGRTGLDVRLTGQALTRLEEDMEPLEPELDPMGLQVAMGMALAGGLNFSDACYVELAVREGAALASRDGKLLDFAAKQGVMAIDLR